MDEFKQPLQGCDEDTDKGIDSICDTYSLTNPNACCYTVNQDLDMKTYHMCNKDGFGDDEPKEADFTEAYCPPCDDTSFASAVNAMSTIVSLLGLSLGVHS